MSRSEYVYVVVGDASRLPVATFTVKHELIRWLESRRGNTLLRLFRFRWNTDRVEISIPALLANPKSPAQEV